MVGEYSTTGQKPNKQESSPRMGTMLVHTESFPSTSLLMEQTVVVRVVSFTYLVEEYLPRYSFCS